MPISKSALARAISPLLFLFLTPGSCAVSDLQCFSNAFIGGFPSFQISDIQCLADSLTNNDPSLGITDPAGIDFDPLSARRFVCGGVQICLQDSFVFAGTHVATADVGGALGQIISTCCTSSTDGTCLGGSFTVTGDTGLEVSGNLDNAGGVCNGG
jgi:hypothetical protein